MSTITYWGHSTTFIQSNGLSLITDPLLSNRVLMAQRKTPFPLNLEDVPEPTVILISHAHYDHLDIHSFKYFSSRVPVILPKGLGKLLGKFVKNPLIELSLGESHTIKPGLKVTSFPVNHFGFRLSGLTYHGTCGYWIELEGKKIFFPGDTGYRSDFKYFANPDVALLPIGPQRPEWWMRPRHLNAADFIRVMEDLQAKITVPIHWGTFKLGMEPLNEPIEELKKQISEKNLSARVTILNPGEKVEF